MTKIEILKRPIFKDNAVMVLLLGLCPALAVSTMAENAIGMGAATTFVLLGSNIVVSLIRKAIPNKVRIPCFIVLIATFTVLAEMLVEAFAYSLYQSLGIFLPLIAVNCVIFARAEVFASKNGTFDSIVDALGSGIGFTAALLLIASFREILGSGQWFGLNIPWLSDNSITIFTLAPGGFIVFACLIAAVNKISKGRALKMNETGCDGCASAIVCGKHRRMGGDE
jgi:electron transport complex protein RnfE